MWVRQFYVQSVILSHFILILYIKDTNEKLSRMFKTHKIRSTFYTENTQSKLLCKSKDGVDSEDESNIAYEIDCNNYEAVHLSNSKSS